MKLKSTVVFLRRELLFNGEQGCKLGDDGMLYISNPDAHGKCFIYLQKEKEQPVILVRNVSEKNAKKKAEDILIENHQDHRDLWEDRKEEKEEKEPATLSQKRLIRCIIEKPWFKEAYGVFTMDKKMSREEAEIFIKFIRKAKVS